MDWLLPPGNLMPESFMAKEEEYLDEEADTGQFATCLDTLSVQVGDEQCEEE